MIRADNPGLLRPQRIRIWISVLYDLVPKTEPVDDRVELYQLCV